MGIKIQNNVAKPIWLRLNSGNSISVFPNQPAPEVDPSEIEGNPAIQRLIDRNLIAKIPVSSGKKGTVKSAVNEKDVKKTEMIAKGSKKTIEEPKKTETVKK